MEMAISEAVYEEIKEAYLRTVAIPYRKGERQLFVCPVGYIGAGKTTVLKQLCRRLPLARVAGDDIRKMLFERGLWTNGLDADLPRKIFNETIDTIAASGHSLAFDSNCGSPAAKERIERLAHNLGARVFWIHVDPPEEFIISKLRHHPPTWLFRSGEEAVARYRYRKETNPRAAFEFFYRFDPSRADLAEQIEQCVTLIHQSFNPTPS